MLIILESTTYPGTTDEVLLPLFETPSLKVGTDFYLCFSPERVNPGNKKYQTCNIPKVVGGTTAECTRLGSLLLPSLAAGCARQFRLGRRNDEIAREHIPDDQYRVGKRDGAHVRSYGYQYLGSD